MIPSRRTNQPRRLVVDTLEQRIVLTHLPGAEGTIEMRDDVTIVTGTPDADSLVVKRFRGGIGLVFNGTHEVTTASTIVAFGLGGPDRFRVAGNVPASIDIIFSGGDDDDYLAGGRGNDELHGDDGDDTIHGASGDNVLHGGDGDDKLTARNGHDQFFAGLGDDQVVARGGDDLIDLGVGRDRATAGWGNDVVYTGNDTDADYADGGRGYDTIYVGQGLEDRHRRFEEVHLQNEAPVVQDLTVEARDYNNHVIAYPLSGVVDPDGSTNPPLSWGTINRDSFQITSVSENYTGRYEPALDFDGQLNIFPDGFTGTATFTFTVEDIHGAVSNEGTLTFVVLPPELAVVRQVQMHSSQAFAAGTPDVEGFEFTVEAPLGDIELETLWLTAEQGGLENGTNYVLRRDVDGDGSYEAIVHFGSDDARFGFVLDRVNQGDTGRYLVTYDVPRPIGVTRLQLGLDTVEFISADTGRNIDTEFHAIPGGAVLTHLNEAGSLSVNLAPSQVASQQVAAGSIVDEVARLRLETTRREDVEMHELVMSLPVGPYNSIDALPVTVVQTSQFLGDATRAACNDNVLPAGFDHYCIEFADDALFVFTPVDLRIGAVVSSTAVSGHQFSVAVLSHPVIDHLTGEGTVFASGRYSFVKLGPNDRTASAGTVYIGVPRGTPGDALLVGPLHEIV